MKKQVSSVKSTGVRSRSIHLAVTRGFVGNANPLKTGRGCRSAGRGEKDGERAGGEKRRENDERTSLYALFGKDSMSLTSEKIYSHIYLHTTQADADCTRFSRSNYFHPTLTPIPILYLNFHKLIFATMKINR